MSDTIVVVGFRMNQKRSIGYKELKTADAASKYVLHLLNCGADVISIRRVKGGDNLRVA